MGSLCTLMQKKLKLVLVCYMPLAKVVLRSAGGAINKPPTRENIMADEDEEQATALAAPLLEDATEAPVNEAPEQSAAEAPEQTPEEPDEGRSTILGVGINLANAIVGFGIVGLPAALKDAGSRPRLLFIHRHGVHSTRGGRRVSTGRRGTEGPCYGSLAKSCTGEYGRSLGLRRPIRF